MRSTHPYRRHRVRSYVADRSLVRLVLAFAAVLSLASFAAAAGLRVVAPEGRSLGELWYTTFLALLGSGDQLTSGADSAAERALGIALAVGAAVASAVLLGALVYKLFQVQQCIEFRQGLAVARFDDEKLRTPNLVLRCYNASDLDLVDVEATAFVQDVVDSKNEAGDRDIRNRELTLHRNRMLSMPPALPTNFLIPLNEGEEAQALEASSKYLQGQELGEQPRLHLILSGGIPSLGTSFREHHVWDLSEPWTQGFCAIQPPPLDTATNSGGDAPLSRARDWMGWDSFDR